MAQPQPAASTRVVRTRAELRDALSDVARPVGLVTTMGWLHDGHRALMRRARDDNATTVATIFVNPRQFNEASDYTRYPRNEARDIAICESEGVDIVFAPPVEEIYLPGFDTTVSVGAVAKPLEGAARPGHFDGVATVVAILFDLVRADSAYFGQKDAQQVMVIRQMARDLAIGTEVITCPTVREPDGLALSSRNVHLSPQERTAATVLRRALIAARDAWVDGERAAEALRALMGDILANEPLANVDYVSVADDDTLEELSTVDRSALVSMAVRFGETRLIDNEILDPDAEKDPGTEVRPQVYGG
ncbi:MAG TPA: pantoate--beta-alanine ligase [Candidatus Limnocylindrales bacterium]|nr:pantoate--beta-alanine ligase [Candidatus Limnocylindrales bacterium]